ncbi:MAG: SsgA family sporulation/cell division regulator [Nocardioidaceae bacterium]
MFRRQRPEPPPQTVEYPTMVMSADGTPQALATLVYDPADPCAVTLDVRTSPGTHRAWSFDRVLLHDAVATAGLQTGQPGGDVQIANVANERLFIQTVCEGGTFLLSLHRDDALLFCERATDLVAIGNEDTATDLDAWLDKTLAGTS